MFSNLLSSLAVLADGAAPASGAAARAPSSGYESFLTGPIPLMAMMVLLFYFMLWRPQARKQKETQNMLKSLKKGDEVVTSGGLIGKITGLADNTITLEVQEKVRLKVVRSHVTGLAATTVPQAGAAPQAAAMPEPQK